MHPSLPLTLAGEGAAVRLASISGEQRTAHRLAELGLTPGVVLTVIRDNGSALIIGVGDTRLALSHALARAILVTPLERNDPHG